MNLAVLPMWPMQYNSNEAGWGPSDSLQLYLTHLSLPVNGTALDGNIELRFADDCCGIASENLDGIFDPFFSTKTEDKRMGIGLDIAQQIHKL